MELKKGVVTDFDKSPDFKSRHGVYKPDKTNVAIVDNRCYNERRGGMP